MSDETDDKLPDNVPGNYYVNQYCIDCQLCQDLAPENFACNEEEEYHYISKQPDSPFEELQVLEALESCPAESIIYDDESCEE